jgi:phosphoesterase RecJ-like protein
MSNPVPDAAPAAAAGALISQIRDAVMSRQRFLITSHARPDGDSIGSQLAMAFALDALGKQTRIINADRAPEHYYEFPGLNRIEIAAEVPADAVADAVIVMECGDLDRTGVRGFEGRYIINVDHHAGNRMYGAINWFDESAAACGEMVYDVIAALGVPMSLEIATHIYLPSDRGGRRQPGRNGAAHLRQQQLRQAQTDRRAARSDAAPGRGTSRRPVHGRWDAGGVRLHAQRH